jgi:hypothetical protein
MRRALGIAVTVCLAGLVFAAEDTPKAKKKPAAPKPKAVEIDPWHRPEGSIVAKPARFYIWYEEGTWSVRTCAQVARQFSGTITVKGGTIKSVLPVGTRKEVKQDAWRVDGDRTKMQFAFKTGQKSDGFDMKVEGEEATIEFNLSAGERKNPNIIFIGHGEQHPGSNPFELPAAPVKPKKTAPAK